MKGHTNCRAGYQVRFETRRGEGGSLNPSLIVLLSYKGSFRNTKRAVRLATEKTFSSSYSPTLSLLDEAVLFIFLVPSRFLLIATMLLRTGVDVDDSHGDA